MSFHGVASNSMNEMAEEENETSTSVIQIVKLVIWYKWLDGSEAKTVYFVGFTVMKPIMTINNLT